MPPFEPHPMVLRNKRQKIEEEAPLTWLQPNEDENELENVQQQAEYYY